MKLWFVFPPSSLWVNILSSLVSGTSLSELRWKRSTKIMGIIDSKNTKLHVYSIRYDYRNRLRDANVEVFVGLKC